MLKIQTRIENGKAYLQFEFPNEWEGNDKGYVILQVKDGEDREVLNCVYPLSEEEPAQGLLLHPHLWNGPEDPYMYKVEAFFINRYGELVERQEQLLALRTLKSIATKGMFLNGSALEIRGVYWDLNITAEALEQLHRMGANTLFFTDSETEITEEDLLLCIEKGFLTFIDKRRQNRDTLGVAYELQDYEISDYHIPVGSSLFSVHSPFFTEDYYRYKALWSREPFVYISMNSIKKQENGNISLMVYSNQKKIAIYVDGILFEFRSGGQEYLFEEIPIKKYPAVITAEAGDCNTAVTLYECSQNFHKYVTFS